MSESASAERWKCKVRVISLARLAGEQSGAEGGFSCSLRALSDNINKSPLLFNQIDSKVKSVYLLKKMN